MASRSAITLRMEAGDKAWGRRWDRVRDPTGSPLVKKASTRWRKTSRGRSVKPCGITKGERGSNAKILKFLILLVSFASVAVLTLGNGPTLADRYMRLHAPFQPRPRPDARRFPDP